jgi:hypothetical protein
MGNCTIPCNGTVALRAQTGTQRRGSGYALESTVDVSPACSGPRSWFGSPELCGLSKIVECFQPLLFEIAGFLAGSPKEFALLCETSANFVSVQIRPMANSLWSDMYSKRWPTFHDCMNFQGLQDWRNLYLETLYGNLECTLEVFEREKKLGFAMAAMPARLQYEARLGAYVARYLSASQVPPEKIPSHEEHRLRFCPESVRAQLLRSCPSESGDAKTPNSPVKKAPYSSNRRYYIEGYPYRVLEGLEGLEVGRNVELQWKMQEGSPFGWWYGRLDALALSADGLAQATITFNHFPTSSRWYRLDVAFGDSRIRDCSFGGYTGGIRPVSEEEIRQCMMFFPKDPVVF